MFDYAAPKVFPVNDGKRLGNGGHGEKKSSSVEIGCKKIRVFWVQEKSGGKEPRILSISVFFLSPVSGTER